MVDMRKMLLGGVINEQYRRFVVFEPYAAVVREYFRMFLANSGNVNKTLIQIWEHGPYFPDPHICKPPDGHKIYYKIRRNDYGWCFKDKPTLVQMLSNASYIGHWIVKNTVVRWHNHPCIVDEDIFYRAFNYLSSIGLDGTCNTHYRPRRSYTRPVQEEAREEERPLCSGLMVSPWENEWKSVGTHWDSIDEHYNYVLCGSDPLATSIWHKKATYVDKSIGLLLLEKLRLTFNFDQWSGALDKFIIDYEQHKQLKRRQLKHLETVMNNLTTSLESISTPGLIAQVEQRYQDAQLEHQRLLDEINTQPPALVNAEKMKALKVSYHHILENWETMTMDEKREIFHVFITKIEILYDKDRVLTFHIYWQDGSTDTMTIRRIASTGVAWLPHEHDLLVQLADGGAGQLEIAKAFPKRRWIAIARKYTTLTGKKLKWVARGNPIRKEETYEDYLRQCTGKEPPNTNVEGSA